MSDRDAIAAAAAFRCPIVECPWDYKADESALTRGGIEVALEKHINTHNRMDMLMTILSLQQELNITRKFNPKGGKQIHVNPNRQRF